MRTNEPTHRPQSPTLDPGPAGPHGRPSLAALALANLPSGIVMFDEQPAVVELNPAAEDLLSVPRVHALGGGVEVLPHLEPFFEAARQVLTTGQGKFHQEATMTLPRGQRTMGFGAVPLQHDGVRIGVLLYFQDITAKRTADTQRRQIERLASLGLIAAGLTEEIADPIHKAGIYADLIQKEDADLKKCQSHAAKLRASLQRASQLSSYVARLLHSPTSEAGPCAMHEVVEGVIGSLQRKAILGSHAVDLRLNATASVIMGEAIDFEHLVMTLLVDAEQSVPMGGSLRVTSTNHTGIFEMTVEARGQAGMVHEDIGHRGSAAALEICRSLVKRYNGAIRVESEGEVLQRFIVRLRPALPEQCAGWAVQGVPTPPIATHHAAGHETVGMVVSDSNVARDCRRWLEESGIAVVAHPTPEAAVDGVAKATAPVLLAHGPADQPSWMGVLRRISDLKKTAIISLLDQSVPPRLRADLDELTGHRSVRHPTDRLSLLQSLALAELEGLDLQRAARLAKASAEKDKNIS